MCFVEYSNLGRCVNNRKRTFIKLLCFVFLLSSCELIPARLPGFECLSTYLDCSEWIASAKTYQFSTLTNVALIFSIWLTFSPKCLRARSFVCFEDDNIGAAPNGMKYSQAIKMNTTKSKAQVDVYSRLKNFLRRVLQKVSQKLVHARRQRGVWA